jgi:DNA gyrase subunit A
MGLEYNKKYTKCAKVVGQAMGVYHPHGDSAIYDTWSAWRSPSALRYPLVDGQGNFGSVDGDPPAAMRYTECRMERIAGELLADIDMETVDFVPNYDESTVEPTVLPTRIPNLIVNGSSGIAVGMATNIPPHNLTEVVNAAIELVKNPKAGLAEVLKHVRAPTSPPAASLRQAPASPGLQNRPRPLPHARPRAPLKISQGSQGDHRHRDPLPGQQVQAHRAHRRAGQRQNHHRHRHRDVRDESDRDGMRIVIGLKRGAQPEIVLNQLYKHTQMQESFSMIFLAVLNGQPRELGLDQAIRVFIDHRIDVVQRRTVFLLRKAREREHILEGYQIALDNLDTVIKHHSRLRLAAREASRKPLRLGQGHARSNHHPRRERRRHEERGLTLLRQIDAILELQLYRLTQLSIDELLNELKRNPRQASPSTNPSSPARKSCAPSSSRSSKTSATSTATPAAPRSSTRPPSFSLKTSSPTSRSPSPSATRATSSARPSPSTASSAAAAPAAWA